MPLATIIPEAIPYDRIQMDISSGEIRFFHKNLRVAVISLTNSITKNDIVNIESLSGVIVMKPLDF